MILLWGLATDRPLNAVHEPLLRAGHQVVLVDQNHQTDVRIELEVRGGQYTGRIQHGRTEVDLRTFRGMYARPYEVRADNDQSIDATLAVLWQIFEGTVINPSDAMASNASKPRQIEMIAEHGFRVPDTLVTTDEQILAEFQRRHPKIIYKSASGIRSKVALISQQDDRFADLVNCPTQFQEYCPGTDVRVHVVGTEVFACRIESTALDYRYPAPGDTAEVTACQLPDDIAERCLRLSSGLGLLVAGIDLRQGPDGAWVCFEVNPSPAFTYFEQATGQPISAAVASLLVR